VVDTSRPLDEDDYEILQIIRDKKVIALFNKQDLAVAADLKTLKEELGQIPVIETSIVENTGLDQFVSTVREMFYKKEINFNDQVYITNARQKSALAAAEDALTKAMDSINMGMSEDFFTIDMMEAYTQLGLLIGETVEDDLADEIFSRFCMGK
jgi:tRNA modification GTPase